MQNFKPRWGAKSAKSPKKGENAVRDAKTFGTCAIDKSCQKCQKSESTPTSVTFGTNCHYGLVPKVEGENAVRDANLLEKPPFGTFGTDLEALLAEHGRLALEVPMADGRQAVLITHDPDRLLSAADGASWWVLRTVDGQFLTIHGPAPVDAVVLDSPAPLPDAVVELLLRYEAGEFEPEARAYLGQVFAYTPDNALELLAEAARELGLEDAVERQP